MNKFVKPPNEETRFEEGLAHLRKALQDNRAPLDARARALMMSVFALGGTRMNVHTSEELMRQLLRDGKGDEHEFLKRHSPDQYQRVRQLLELEG